MLWFYCKMRQSKMWCLLKIVSVHLTLAICNLVILSKSKSKRSDTDFKIGIWKSRGFFQISMNELFAKIIYRCKIHLSRSWDYLNSKPILAQCLSLYPSPSPPKTPEKPKVMYISSHAFLNPFPSNRLGFFGRMFNIVFLLFLLFLH